MIKRIKKVVSVTLADRDRKKLDLLATAMRMNRSECVRFLIKSKRIPKNNKTKPTVLGGRDADD
ncbi:MAG: hypothetical protein JW715_14660 [Sedimentisphaerales bacterium]|nr:hypothetical protein [Sedimentisphaerales bacterium]